MHFKINSLIFILYLCELLLQIGSDFAPKQPNGAWAPHYHGLLYNLTDDAIQVCPPETSWLIVTNGDNEYGKSFLTRVLTESTAAADKKEGLVQEGDENVENKENILPPSSLQTALDMIAFDYYSRYQQITMPACDRFTSQSSSGPLCKRNNLKWCQTDLGAAALNYHRFREENRKFGDVVDHDPFQRLLGTDSADGVMMETLVYDGWKVSHVTDTCLFVHAPSIQSCAWQGGVWDDRDLIKISGGQCLTQEEANTILKENSKNIEEVRIDVSNDGKVSSEYEGTTKLEEKNKDFLIGVRCLRRKNFKEESILGLTQVWYSEWCVDKEDESEFRKMFDTFYPTEEAIEAAQEAAQRHAETAEEKCKNCEILF